MTKGFKVAPKRVAGTCRAVLPHEKLVTVTTAAQHMSSPFSENVGKIGGGSPWAYWIGYELSGGNVVVMNKICYIKNL